MCTYTHIYITHNYKIDINMAASILLAFQKVAPRKLFWKVASLQKTMFFLYRIHTFLFLKHQEKVSAVQLLYSYVEIL